MRTARGLRSKRGGKTKGGKEIKGKGDHGWRSCGVEMNGRDTFESRPRSLVSRTPQRLVGGYTRAEERYGTGIVDVGNPGFLRFGIADLPQGSSGYSPLYQFWWVDTETIRPMGRVPGLIYQYRQYLSCGFPISSIGLFIEPQTFDLCIDLKFSGRRKKGGAQVVNLGWETLLSTCQSL